MGNGRYPPDSFSTAIPIMSLESLNALKPYPTTRTRCNRSYRTVSYTHLDVYKRQVYEEPEKEEPLTPDGNATLVDDFGGNKQLITVTTKNGNYFYIPVSYTHLPTKWSLTP